MGILLEAFWAGKDIHRENDTERLQKNFKQIYVCGMTSINMKFSVGQFVISSNA